MVWLSYKVAEVSLPAQNSFPAFVGQHQNTENRKNDLILIMTPEKQDKTLELSKHWSVDSTPARNEVIMQKNRQSVTKSAVITTSIN